MQRILLLRDSNRAWKTHFSIPLLDGSPGDVSALLQYSSCYKHCSKGNDGRKCTGSRVQMARIFLHNMGH